MCGTFLPGPSLLPAQKSRQGFCVRFCSLLSHTAEHVIYEQPPFYTLEGCVAYMTFSWEAMSHKSIDSRFIYY